MFAQHGQVRVDVDERGLLERLGGAEDGAHVPAIEPARLEHELQTFDEELPEIVAHALERPFRISAGRLPHQIPQRHPQPTSGQRFTVEQDAKDAVRLAP